MPPTVSVVDSLVAEVPGPEFPQWQFFPDISRVIVVNPRIIVSRALLMVKDGEVTLVHRFQNLTTLLRICGLQLFEGHLGAELEPCGAVVSDSFVMQKCGTDVSSVKRETAAERRAVFECL